jgi:hypothetical protein
MIRVELSPPEAEGRVDRRLAGRSYLVQEKTPVRSDYPLARGYALHSP